MSLELTFAASLAAVFAGVGIVAWWTLRRHARAESSTTAS